MTSSASVDRENRWWSRRLAWPVVSAAAVRLALLVFALVRGGTSIIASGDTASYLEPGRNLLLHGRFVTAGLPEIGRTPGYPIFLAVASLPGSAFAALAQVILSAFTVVLVWRLARAVFEDERIALTAAWLFAFEPVSVVYSVRLMPETLFLLLWLLSLERLTEFLLERRFRVLAEAGLWLAAAIFVRPVGYYLPLALALGLIVALARVPGLRWKAPAILLISVLPWLAAWQVRNWVETGFGGFSSIVARNLYFYQTVEVTARVEHRPFVEVQSQLGYPDEQAYLDLHPEQAAWSQSQRIAYMNSQATQVLRSHPGVYLRTHVEGSAVVAFTPCAADLLRLLAVYPEDGETPKRVVNEGPARAALRLAKAHPGPAAAMAVLEFVLLCLYLLAVRGAICGPVRRDVIWLMLGVSLYFLAVSGGAQGVGRLRLPVMPIVCIFAAAGLRRRNCPGPGGW